ncbi:MAG: PrsW family glutamic-type intramembrane protease [bacterium]
MSIVVSLLPVIMFLLLLNSLDTFKLLKPSFIATAMIWGFISAISAYFINSYFFSFLDSKIVSGLTAPITEETLKIGIVVYFFYKAKVGFLADSLIIGFAAGAGFSIIENIVYLDQFASHNFMLWVIRGFGTAIMHGTSTAIAAVIIQNLVSKKEKIQSYFILVGLSAGIGIHAVFNSFLLPPLFQTVLQITFLPVIVINIFNKSEKSLRNWMEEQSNSEFELLRIIKRGEFKTTRTGKYILSIKSRFPQEVIFDILAYIQLHLELSIKAKGMLLMKEAGFETKEYENIKSMLNELDFLSKSIGKTGMRTLTPIIHISKKDLWKINMLK